MEFVTRAMVEPTASRLLRALRRLRRALRGGGARAVAPEPMQAEQVI